LQKRPCRRTYILQKSPTISKSLLIVATPYQTQGHRILDNWAHLCENAVISKTHLRNISRNAHISPSLFRNVAHFCLSLTYFAAYLQNMPSLRRHICGNLSKYAVISKMCGFVYLKKRERCATFRKRDGKTWRISRDMPSFRRHICGTSLEI